MQQVQYRTSILFKSYRITHTRSCTIQSNENTQLCTKLFHSACLTVAVDKHKPLISYLVVKPRTDRQPFNGLFSRKTWVNRNQKGQINLDFNEARDDSLAVTSARPFANHLHLPPDT